MSDFTIELRQGLRSHRGRPFLMLRSGIDQRVLDVFGNKAIRRNIREQTKVNLEVLWVRTAHVMSTHRSVEGEPILEQLDIHESIVKGLPGEALYISCAMAFDSMQEALPFFDMSAKTARLKIGELLSANQGEIALRIGRVLTMAGDLFGSPDAARTYLRTPNFALGGAMPRDLLKTAEGEQLVLSELQTQAESGPV